jgi:hypothetical protein
MNLRRHFFWGDSAARVCIASSVLAIASTCAHAQEEPRARKGQQLVAKIAMLQRQVTIVDAENVLRLFGFSEYAYSVGQNYVRVFPMGASGQARPDEMAGSGLLELSVDPWRRPGKGSRDLLAVYGRFDIANACVEYSEVAKVFGAPSATDPYLDIHPTPAAPRVNDVGHVTFKLLPQAAGLSSSVTFTFAYQQCALSFVVGARPTSTEEKQ